ncbi:MAG: 50S ribosome-binding GTPase [Ignavibacteriales bacterium]|nr:50S ribosome-binding GTPase [Ignavibacteriales bacterium]
MPTNLPPEYFRAEQKFKEARTDKEKIELLEELIGTIPKHKGTDKLRAEYRRKLSQLRVSAQKSKKGAKQVSEYHIEKEGAARIVIIGTSNVGKSSLVAKLSKANPDVSENPFTTWHPTPGMVEFENIQLQFIDTPPIDIDFFEPEFIELLKSSDLLLVIFDIQGYPLQQLDKINNLLLVSKITPLNNEKINSTNQHFFKIPILIVVNKVENEKYIKEYQILEELLKDEGWNTIPISVEQGINLKSLLQRIVKETKIIRIFSKPPGKEVDYTKPFIIKEGSTIGEFALQVHNDFYEKLKLAKVWGKGVFDGQSVGKEHLLNDGDIVELHI